MEDITPKFWKKRMEQINNFEEHITQNGTLVLKFYMHLSKDEQRKRLFKTVETRKTTGSFQQAI